MDSARELAQLLERPRELVAGPRDQLLGGGGVAPDVGGSEPQLQRDADQSLLRAVVQVALQAAPLRGARGHDPLPRGTQLLHAGRRLHAQPLVLRAQPGVLDGARAARPGDGRRRHGRWKQS